MQVRGVLVGWALVAACGGPAGSDGAEVDVEPVALVGTTEQGMRMRIDVVGEREVRLRLPADCPRDDDPEDFIPTSLDRHPLVAEVADDGSFSLDESYVEDGTDGDEEHVDVRVAGRFADDGTATGTFEVTGRWWNGQGNDFGAPCTTGTLEWTATDPHVERDDVVVPLTAAGDLSTSAGSDLLVVTATGEVLRIDTGGDARRLDGSPPAPAPPEEESVGGAGPGMISAPAEQMLWQRGVAVVADGVWMPDASGVLTRYELADGQATARVETELHSMAAGLGALWTVAFDPWRRTSTLQKRDPTTGEVRASAPVLDGTLVVGPTELWYAYVTLAGERMDRIDLETAAPVETHEIDADQHAEVMVATADRVWLLDWSGLASVDPATGRPEVVDLPTAPDTIGSVGAAGAGGVWTTHPREAVARLVEDGEVVRIVDIPEGWWNVTTTDDGAVWLTGGFYDDPRVVRLDPTATAPAPAGAR